MKFVSTRGDNHFFSFHEAVFHGLAPDGGLFIPDRFPHLDRDDIEHAYRDSLTELGERLMQLFVSELPTDVLQHIICQSLNFPIPLVHLEDNIYLLEVFHGPTLAFKDVGARFMANTLSYFLTRENKKLNIIVATSGDTGSAIANAFYRMPNIDIFILYPSGQITFLQEQQMTTLGENVHAIEVQGSFDDCQRLVKAALMSPDIRKQRLVTTANSINIARLLPQLIYHSFGVCQLRKQNITTPPVLSVPSGNFGNLTSGIYAKMLGFDIQHFIAATNINDIVPQYLQTHLFEPKPSLRSLSNAMDVGNPSNFERLLACFDGDFNAMSQMISGVSVTDSATLAEIKGTYDRTQYILDPHTAVGVRAARQSLEFRDKPIIVTATAHPAKFPAVIRQALDIDAEMPERLRAVLDGKKQADLISPDLEALISLLSSRT